MKEKSLFETKIKPVLTYVGSIGAGLSCIAYIILIILIITGFKFDRDFRSAIAIAIINAVFGIIILVFAKVQGMAFAEKEHEDVIDEHNKLCKKKKNKKIRTNKYFWIKTSITDVISKGLTTCISIFAIIYFSIKGNGNYKLIWLAFTNILLFLSFGCLSLVKAYKFYIRNTIPMLEKEIEDIKKEQTNETIQGEGTVISSEATGTEEQDKVGTKEVQEVS